MRIIFLLVLSFSSLIQLYSQNFWEQFTAPDSVSITCLLADPSGALFVGSWYQNGKGGVFRSDDNGLTWNAKNEGISNRNILSMDQDDYGIIYAGAGNNIYRSLDLGESWEHVFNFSEYAVNLNTVSCGNNGVILVGGQDGCGIIRSADQGDTWQIVLDIEHYGFFEMITDISFGPDDAIYASSRMILSNEPCNLYVSYDQGLTWQVFDTTENTYFMSLGFDNQGRLLGGAYGKGVARYDFNDGYWEYVTAGYSSPEDILVVPNNMILLACSNFPNFQGGVMLSYDGGDNYIQNNSGLFENMNSARQFETAPSGKILLLNSGCLFRTTDVIFTGLQECRLQNGPILAYPNPFGPGINFKLAGTGSKNSRIKVYNSCSQCIYSSEINMVSDLYWETGNLPAGFYYVLVEYEKSTNIFKILHY